MGWVLLGRETLHYMPENWTNQMHGIPWSIYPSLIQNMYPHIQSITHTAIALWNLVLWCMPSKWCTERLYFVYHLSKCVLWHNMFSSIAWLNWLVTQDYDFFSCEIAPSFCELWGPWHFQIDTTSTATLVPPYKTMGVVTSDDARHCSAWFHFMFAS